MQPPQAAATAEQAIQAFNGNYKAAEAPTALAEQAAASAGQYR